MGSLADFPAEIVVEEGNVANEIVAQAHARGVDLIVIGTHGHGGFVRFTLGSTTERCCGRRPALCWPCPPPTRPHPRGFVRSCARPISRRSASVLSSTRATWPSTT